MAPPARVPRILLALYLPSQARGRLCFATRPSPPGTVPFQEIVPMMTIHPFAPDRAVTHAGLQENFLRILPGVQQHARCYFRHLDAEAREEAVAQATALA